MPENKQRSDARQNKARILGTVNQLSQQGVDISEMKITEIAKQANVGVGTLYRHFENKAVLCIAMMDAQVETMFDEIQQFLATHATATAYERVKGILQIYVDLKETHFHTLSFIEKSINRSISIVQIPFYQQLAETISEQLDETEQGHFKTHLLLNCFSNEFYYFAKNDLKLSKEAYIQQVLDVLLK